MGKSARGVMSSLRAHGELSGTITGIHLRHENLITLLSSTLDPRLSDGREAMVLANVFAGRHDMPYHARYYAVWNAHARAAMHLRCCHVHQVYAGPEQ